MLRYLKYILFLFLAVSCVKEEAWEENALPQEVDVCVSLDVMGEDVRTKADGDDVIGNAISNFWVIQYDGLGDDAKVIGSPQYFPSIQTFVENGKKVKLVRSTEKNRVVFIANTFDPLMTFPQDSDYGDLKRRWNAVTDSESFLGGAEGARYVMFNGSVETVISGAISLSCKLTRNVAKISFKLINSSSNVTITSWQIKNVPSVSYLYTHYTLPYEYPAIGDFSSVDYPTVECSLGPKASETAPEAYEEYVVYVPVNKRGVNEAITDKTQKNAEAYTGATYLQVNATYDGWPVQYAFYLGADLVNDFNLLPNHAYSYVFNISSQGQSGDSRVTELGAVDFSKIGELANCYIINPAQTAGVSRKFIIPVSRVDEFWGGQKYEKNNTYALGESNPWVVRIIATNFDNSENKLEITDATGNGKNDTFSITVAPSLEGNPTRGNAIVALYRVKSDGQVSAEASWSWHLWITDYVPDEAYTKTPTENVYAYPVTGGVVHRYEGTIWHGEYANRFIMDRNLGAWGTGYAANGNGTLYYQYGRKDPFFGSASTIYLYGSKGFVTEAYEGLNKDLTMSFVVQNPMTFITTKDRVAWTMGSIYNPESFDANILWQDPYATSTGKSIFDPCPPGYCVPKSDAWSDFRPQYYTSYNTTDGTLKSYREESKPTTNIEPLGNMRRGFPSYSSTNKGCYYWPYSESDSTVPTQPVYYPACGVLQNTGYANLYGLSDHVYMASANAKSINNPWFLMANNAATQKTVGGNTGLGRAHAGTVRCITVRD